MDVLTDVHGTVVLLDRAETVVDFNAHHAIDDYSFIYPFLPSVSSVMDCVFKRE